MTVDELLRIFEVRHDEYLKFDRIAESARSSNRPDLHAFMKLDRLIPGTDDIICASEHDEITLDVTPERLAAAATEDDLVELIRCGVRFDRCIDCFRMFA